MIFLGSKITPEDVYNVATDTNVKVSLSESAKKKIEKNRKKVEEVLKKEKPVYGINTGFGSLSSVKIKDEDIKKLQVNLIRSHACGVGKTLSDKYVRAMMMLRANNASIGYSGVRPVVIEKILFFLNNNIIPIIPEKGSVGASGDLCPLSHLTLALIGEGEVRYKGKIRNSKDVLGELNEEPLILDAKEGLALINGTQFMSAIGCIALIDSENLLKHADLIATMTIDAMLGSFKPFDNRISNLRPHKGQLTVSNNITKLSKGSSIAKSHENCNKIQDSYSLRCIPQVHGAVRDAISYLRNTLSIEINSVTDNPIVFEDEIISGGNFHGAPIALALDFAAIALTDLGSISERRTDKILDPNFNSGLPAYLTSSAGLNSGFMIAQYTAAALTNENKVLSHPASVDSIPTSGNKEDHVSMGATSANKLRKIIDNLENILSIELIVAGEGLEKRKEKSSDAVKNVLKEVRKEVLPLEEDRVVSYDIKKIKELIKSRKLLRGVEIE